MLLSRVSAATLALVVLAGFAAECIAQSPPIRIRGEIVKADAQNVVIKGRDGNDYTVKLADNARIGAMVKSSLADIKPNSYIGVTAMPAADGSQRAMAIHIFMEAQRGTAEGHTPWDREPGSTMTNATVTEAPVSGVDGQTINVKYKDGEKKIVVLPQTTIVAMEPGDRGELKAGTKVIVFGARKQDDGSFAAPAISYGRAGIEPPM